MKMKLVELDLVFEPVNCEMQAIQTILSGVIKSLRITFMLRDTNLFSALRGLEKGTYLLKSSNFKARYYVGCPTDMIVSDRGLVSLVYNNITEEIVND